MTTNSHRQEHSKLKQRSDEDPSPCLHIPASFLISWPAMTQYIKNDSGSISILNLASDLMTCSDLSHKEWSKVSSYKSLYHSGWGSRPSFLFCFVCASSYFSSHVSCIHVHIFIRWCRSCLSDRIWAVHPDPDEISCLQWFSCTHIPRSVTHHSGSFMLT